MKNTENKEFEFSFSAIFKIFKGKLKSIILVGLVAAILGAGISTSLTLLIKRAYGNLLIFYLPTAEQNEYVTILPLLESDLFLEKILISSSDETYTDENGKSTTVRVPDLPFTKDDKELYKKYTAQKLQAQKKLNELKTYFKDSPYEMTMLKEELSRKTSDYTATASLLNTYMSVQDPTISEGASPKIPELEAKLKEATEAKDEAEIAYNAKVNEYHTNEKEYHEAEIAITEADEQLDALTAPLYEKWKQDDETSKEINLAKEGIQYSFSRKELYPEEYETNDKKEFLSSKFLYVKIEIEKDEELAAKIVENISKEMNDFIIFSSIPTEKYDIIKSSCISVPTSHTIYKTDLIPSIVKYTVVITLIAEALYICKIVFPSFKGKLLGDDDTADPETDLEDKKELPENNS